MKSLKEILQNKTRQARTIDAVVRSIIRDMFDTANIGGSFVSWQEDKEYYPAITVVEVFAKLTSVLTAANSGLLVELKDNQERIKLVFEKNKTSIRQQKFPEFKQWIVVRWEALEDSK